MFRRLNLYFLLFIFLFNAVGYVVVLEIREYRNQRNVEAILRGIYKKPEIEKLSFTSVEKAKLHWEFNGNEFEYQGKFYDVVARKIENGKHIFFCYNDKKEMAIKNQFNNIVKHQNDSDKSGNLSILKKVFSNYYPVSFTASLFEREYIVLKEKIPSGSYLFSEKPGFLNQEIPPPEGIV